MENSKVDSDNNDGNNSRRQDAAVTQYNGPIRRLWTLLRWLYLQYVLHIGIYVLEPWEAAIFNCVLVAVLLCAVYTACLFLPGHVVMLSRFLFRFPGDDVTDVQSSSSSGLGVTS